MKSPIKTNPDLFRELVINHSRKLGIPPLHNNWIAGQVGVEQSTFHRYLSGERKMPERLVAPLAKLLNANKLEIIRSFGL